MLENDRPLLDAYRRGDAAALTTIFKYFSPIVARHLTHRGVRAIDLEAAQQEAFIRIFADNARMQYDGLRPFQPYVLAVARFAAIDVLRAQGKLRHTVPIDDALLAIDADSPEQAAMVAEAQALVRQFLGTLSDRDQQFARLRFIDGLSQDEAGKQSGYSRQEARTREDKLKGQCVKFLSQKGWPHPALALAVLALVMRG